jgi:hypothetical protein
MTAMVPSLPVHAVVWEDASYSDTEKIIDPTFAVTVGVIVEKTEKYIQVACEVFDDKTSRHHTRIPKTMVLRILRVGSVKLPEFAKPDLPDDDEPEGEPTE